MSTVQEKSIHRGKVQAINPEVGFLVYSPDDAGNAECMRDLYKGKFMYSPSLGWLEYVGTHWSMVSEASIVRASVDTLRTRRHVGVDASSTGDKRGEAIIAVTKGDNSRIHSCMSLFQSHVTIEDIEVLDCEPDKLNCLNGVLDLRTGELTPHSPTHLFTYVVPVNYNTLANKVLWGQFLKGFFVETAIIDYAQKCVGYSVTGSTREEKLFYVQGERRSGKGTFSGTLLTLLPEPIGRGDDFNTFTRKREGSEQNFDLASLRSTRFVVASESNKYQSLNPAKIKQLTGRDRIRACMKHKDAFYYDPQFKVWLFSNHPVNADPDDDALWGRIQVFKSPVSYFGREDTTLKDRLKEQEALEGVLLWVLEGARRWYAEGLGSPPVKVEAWTTEHRDKQDFVKQWVEDNTLLKEGSFTSSKELLANYKLWCEENNTKEIRVQDFVESLVKRFAIKKCQQGKERVRGYSGIYLKKPSDYKKEEEQKQLGNRTVPTLPTNGNHTFTGVTHTSLSSELQELKLEGL